MKKRAYKRSKRTWLRVGVWGAVATLLVLSIGWLFPAQAATPTWWDCDYGYRKQLTVSAVSAVPTGYTVSLTFDHAALVTAGKSKADGDDIRIVYWNGSGWVVLDRWLDPDSSWNNSATKVWFKLQAAIASSGSDGNYYLYYSNTLATNPPDIPGNIFLYYDGFESGDFSAWGAATAGPGDSITIDTGTVKSGTYSAKASVDGAAGDDFARVEKNFAGQSGLHATTFVYIPAGYNATSDVTVIQNYTGGWGEKVASLAIRAPNTDMRGLLGNFQPVPGSPTWTFTGSALTTGAWHRFETKVIIHPTNGRIEIWLDGVKEIDQSSLNTDTGNIDFNLFGIFWKNGNSEPSTIYVDDTFTRVWVDPEPTTGLGAEEANDCPPGDPPLCTWPYRRQLTFDNSAQAENLTDFPVLVVLDSSNIDYSKTQDAGQDLRFYDADGATKLSHEIEEWNEAGKSYIWVKVPQINASSNTDHILMYYGHPTVPDGQDPTAVWSNGFEAVWHLHNDFNDSTSNNHDATNNGSADSPGLAGHGQRFNNTETEYIDTNYSSNYGAGQNFTWEGWFAVTTITRSDDIMGIEDRFSGAGDKSEIRLAIREGAAGGGNPVDQYDTWIRPDSGTSYGSSVAISPTGAQWHYAVLLRDGSTGRLYLDGTQVDSKVNISTAALTFPNTLLIGAQWETDVGGSSKRNWFEGSMDEVRTSTTARSAGWIAAQYLSILDNFITFGSEASVGTTMSYFSPDAAAAGMSVPVTFFGNICAVPIVTTSSSDIVVGPSILTNATGAVVTQDGSAVSTMFFIKPDARPATGITVYFDAVALSDTFDIVIPTPDPNVTSGSASLSGRTDRGTSVLGGLTVASGATLTIDTNDTDAGSPGNQGYLPAMVLVKGDVDISGTLDVRGQDGSNGTNGSAGGAGGVGGPGGGGGGGGGAQQEDTAGAGGDGLSGGGGGGSKGTGGGGGIAYVRSGGVTGTSFTLDIGSAGTDRLVIVFLGNEGSEQPGTQVTVDGKNANLVRKAHNIVGADNHHEMWYADEDDLGTSAGIVTIAFTGGDAGWAIHAHLYTGVVQTGPAGSWFNDTAALQTTIPVTGVNVPANGLVVMGAGQGSSGSATGWTAPLTERTDSPNPSSAVLATASAVETSAQTAKTYTSTMSVSFNRGTGIVAAFAEATGGGGACAGGAGGAGTGAAGGAASSCNGGAGGAALSGATGGGSGLPNTETTGGDGGGGGTGDPAGAGGGIGGPFADGAPGGEGGGGGGASGGSPGGGGGGAYATAGGTLNGVEGDAGLGGNVTGNAQLIGLAGGSGGAGGGPNKTIDSVGAGGGGGGGAIMLYATGSVSVTGTITADGGDGGAGYNGGAEGSAGGGGGSGGAFLIQSGNVTASGTLTTAGGTAGTGGDGANAAGGAGGDGRIRMDGLAASGTVPGTAGSKFIGPVIDTLVGATVTGRADGGSSVTLYVFDETGAQVTGSPYTTSASGSTGSVGTWTATGVTFPSGTAYLAVKQTSGSVQVFGPGRSTKGIHLINWREVY